MPSLENPFTPESKKPKRSLVGIFRGDSKGVGDVDKALKNAVKESERTWTGKK